MHDELMALADELAKAGRANWTHPKREAFAERMRALATQQPEAGEVLQQLIEAAVCAKAAIGSLKGSAITHVRACAHDKLRQALERIEKEQHTAAPKAEAQDKLRAFAQDVMECWPEGSPDGGDIQEFAERHGLIKPVSMPGPCGEGCGCSEFYTEEDAPFDCYRKTTLLTGKPESDAEIAALSAQRAEGG